MKKIDTENVEKNVEKPAKKKPSIYKAGPFPFTLIHRKTKVLYVRKSITLNRVVKNPKTGEEKFVKQRQVWRTCQTGTKEEYDKILKSIETDFALAKTGKVKPARLFSELATRFAAAELQPAIFRDNKKVAGKIQVEVPKLYLKTLVEHFGNSQTANITYGDIAAFKQIRLNTPVEREVKIITPIPKEKRPKDSRKHTKTEKMIRRTPRSIRSVNYELSILKQVLNFAVQNRWLDRNPFADGKNLIDATQENRRSVTWTREEEKRALALCTDQAAHMKAIIICITDGGFRSDELLSAKWSDVDLDAGVMLAKNYKGKNLRVRPVFMTARMKNTLLEWRQEQKNHPNADTSLVIGYKGVKGSWDRIRKEIGRADLRIHDLRHVFATRLSQNKVPLDNISKLLGHGQINTTIIYLNPSQADLRSSVQTLEE